MIFWNLSAFTSTEVILGKQSYNINIPFYEKVSLYIPIITTTPILYLKISYTIVQTLDFETISLEFLTWTGNLFSTIISIAYYDAPHELNECITVKYNDICDKSIFKTNDFHSQINFCDGSLRNGFLIAKF